MRLPFCLMFAATALAQAPVIKPPLVSHDGKAHFEFRDANAKSVALNLEGSSTPFPMQRNAEGVWTYTSDPLKPQIYNYKFDVDGVKLLDPSNHAITPNLLNPSSQLLVPGSTPQPWEPTDIPHGTLHHHYYKSTIVGDNRDFFVYTPPGYDPAASTRYPALYLLHGYSDSAGGWTDVGKANLIFDALIAQNKITPMIVVMPLGYGDPAILEGKAPFRDPALRDRNFSRFTEALLTEVMPMAEKTYLINTNRTSRAIAGLSMGGAESLLTGLNNLDKFAYVGAFSSGGIDEGDIGKAFPKLTADANSQLKQLWIACGTDDHLIQFNRRLKDWLHGKDVHFTNVETPGMHTWMVWRQNLVAFTPLLFREQPGT